MNIISKLPQQLSSHLWLMGHPSFNLYLVRGERSTALIETGISAVADTVIGQLKELNVRPDFLIVMHPHGDHISGLATLREKYPDAKVICAEGAGKFISNPRMTSALINDDRHMTSFLREQDLNINRESVTSAPDLSDAMIMHDRDVLDLGGCRLHFSAALGHSPAALVVHIPEDDALMVSDALGFYYPRGRFFPIYFTGYAAYMAELERFQAMNPTLLGIAHFGPFVGYSDIIRGFQLARQCAAGMRGLIRNSKISDEQLIQDIYHDFYREEMLLYSRENIIDCCKLLIKRSRED